MKYLQIAIFPIILSPNYVIAGWFGPDNYWECLIKEMQHVHTDTVAAEVIDNCKGRYPFHERVFVEKKSSWFGPKSASACVLKYGKNVQTELGARHIQSACYKLYPDK